MTTSTEFKKAIYQQNPTAYFEYIRDGIVYYSCSVKLTDGISWYDHTIYFEIPFEETKGSTFGKDMPAKLLNRWLKVIDDEDII